MRGRGEAFRRVVRSIAQKAEIGGCKTECMQALQGEKKPERRRQGKRQPSQCCDAPADRQHGGRAPTLEQARPGGKKEDFGAYPCGPEQADSPGWHSVRLPGKRGEGVIETVRALYQRRRGKSQWQPCAQKCAQGRCGRRRGGARRIRETPFRQEKRCRDGERRPGQHPAENCFTAKGRDQRACAQIADDEQARTDGARHTEGKTAAPGLPHRKGINQRHDAGDSSAAEPRQDQNDTGMNGGNVRQKDGKARQREGQYRITPARGPVRPEGPERRNCHAPYHAGPCRKTDPFRRQAPLGIPDRHVGQIGPEAEIERAVEQRKTCIDAGKEAGGADHRRGVARHRRRGQWRGLTSDR